MSNVTPLLTVVDKNNEETITQLRDALRRAEAGEVIAVSGILELSTGDYMSFGSPTLSRLQTAGALLELAVQRLR